MSMTKTEITEYIDLLHRQASRGIILPFSELSIPNVKGAIWHFGVRMG